MPPKAIAKKKETKEKFKFVDMCCGIGAFHISLKALGGMCVLACDHNAQVKETYMRNHGHSGMQWHDDLFDLKELPEHDVFCAGFPCTTFSMAGDRKGVDDKEGRVIFHLMKLLKGLHAKEKGPGVVMLENVVGLNSIHEGRVMKYITDSLDRMGYAVVVKQFDAADFGAPMHRSRLLIIGTLESSEDGAGLKTKKKVSHLAGTEPAMVSQMRPVRDFVDPRANAKKELRPHDERYVMLAEEQRKMTNSKIFVGYLTKVNYLHGDMTQSNNHGQALKIYDVDGLTENFTGSHRQAFLMRDPTAKRKDDREIVRYLTPREMYACMGFPKGFKMYPKNSTTQLLQLSKSVNVFMLRPVCKWVMKRFLEKSAQKLQPRS